MGRNYTIYCANSTSPFIEF